nr:hypothetical protein [Tanacetum cinerariifolium]
MWKAIERLKQGESINVQDLETNLYWEFRKFTSRDGESLKSYYSRFYKMMNELFKISELEAHYMYMAKIQEVSLNTTENSGPIFVAEPLHEVQNNDDHYNVFANNGEHLVQPEYVNDTYLKEQGDTNITIDSLNMSTNGETVDQDDSDLANERDLLASLIEKQKCEIDDSKNRNKFLETSNKALVDKLK